MFDLNREMARWKTLMARSGSCSADEIEELESHVRDETAAFVAAGRPEQQAFEASLQRLGQWDAICGEFAKNGHVCRCDSLVLWANSVMVVLVVAGSAVLAMWVAARRQDGLLAIHLGAILFGYCTAFLVSLSGAYAIVRCMITQSRAELFRTRFVRHLQLLLTMALGGCVSGTIFGAWWARREWGQYWSWHPKEIGAIAVIACLLLLVLFVNMRRLSSVRLGQACLALSLVTSGAWFGAGIYASTGVAPVVVMLLSVLVTIQLVLFCLPLLQVALRPGTRRLAG